MKGGFGPARLDGMADPSEVVSVVSSFKYGDPSSIVRVVFLAAIAHSAGHVQLDQLRIDRLRSSLFTSGFLITCSSTKSI